MCQLRPVFIILLLSLLAGCTSLHQRETLDLGGDGAAWQAHRATLEPIQSWTLQGKIGVRSPQESGSGTLTWVQQQDKYDIRISGPLGRGATRLQGSQQGVVLDMAGQPTMQALSAEALLEQQTGWRLPVEHLLWWVRGLPAPDGASRLQLDSQSRLARLAQAGWTLEYSRYQEVNGLQLPQRLQLSADNILLTLVITQWNLPEQP
jgi:outer membrane lipoprotein LolB